MGSSAEVGDDEAPAAQEDAAGDRTVGNMVVVGPWIGAAEQIRRASQVAKVVAVQLAEPVAGC
jgi:hypothetical protein